MTHDHIQSDQGRLHGRPLRRRPGGEGGIRCIGEIRKTHAPVRDPCLEELPDVHGEHTGELLRARERGRGDRVQHPVHLEACGPHRIGIRRGGEELRGHSGAEAVGACRFRSRQGRRRQDVHQRRRPRGHASVVSGLVICDGDQRFQRGCAGERRPTETLRVSPQLHRTGSGALARSDVRHLHPGGASVRQARRPQAETVPGGHPEEGGRSRDDIHDRQGEAQTLQIPPGRALVDDEGEPRVRYDRFAEDRVRRDHGFRQEGGKGREEEDHRRQRGTGDRGPGRRCWRSISWRISSPRGRRRCT